MVTVGMVVAGAARPSVRALLLVAWGRRLDRAQQPLVDLGEDSLCLRADFTKMLLVSVVEFYVEVLEERG